MRTKLTEQQIQDIHEAIKAVNNVDNIEDLEQLSYDFMSKCGEILEEQSKEEDCPNEE